MAYEVDAAKPSRCKILGGVENLGVVVKILRGSSRPVAMVAPRVKP